jgi:hypothetical protein
MNAFEIIENDLFLTIAWDPPEGPKRRRSYGDAGLRELLRNAQSARGSGPDEPRGLGESMRVIGQDLDAAHLSLSGAHKRPGAPRTEARAGETPALPGGIQVATVSAQQEIGERSYSSDELDNKSRLRRAKRIAPVKAKPWWRRFLRIAAFTV